MSRTALFKAAWNWDTATLVRVLERSPALIEAQDASGRRALHVCAKRPWPEHKAESVQGLETLRVLIEAGTPADVVQPIPEDGEIFPATPLWYAVAHGRNPEMTRVLLDRGCSPQHCLFAAVWTDDVDILQMLIRAGAPLERRSEGVTPLLYAARLGREASVRALLTAGADNTAVDRKGLSALQLARRNKRADTLLSLLSA